MKNNKLKLESVTMGLEIHRDTNEAKLKVSDNKSNEIICNVSIPVSGIKMLTKHFNATLDYLENHSKS